MPLIPPLFLFRLAFQCPRVADIPDVADDELFALPDECRLLPTALLSPRPWFADVRCAWNEQGLAVQVDVRGKDLPPLGDVSRPHGGDGLRLWIDTRDTRNIHRASRFCHHFYFLPRGGGPDGDQPLAGQTRLPRAQQDAPLAAPQHLLVRTGLRRSGYRLTVFLTAAALHGFDPENHPRLGFYFVIRDQELGEQSIGLGPEFPYWEDPSLWSTLELVGASAPADSNRRRRGKRE